MTKSVKLFAAARELVGRDEVEVELSAQPTVGELRKCLGTTYPALQSLLPHTLFAVDTAYANDETPISDTAEIACIPPVSGG